VDDAAYVVLVLVVAFVADTFLADTSRVLHDVVAFVQLVGELIDSGARSVVAPPMLGCAAVVAHPMLECAAVVT
jgi:hypothetical protein